MATSCGPGLRLSNLIGPSADRGPFAANPFAGIMNQPRLGGSFQNQCEIRPGQARMTARARWEQDRIQLEAEAGR